MNQLVLFRRIKPAFHVQKETLHSFVEEKMRFRSSRKKKMHSQLAIAANNHPIRSEQTHRIRS